MFWGGIIEAFGAIFHDFQWEFCISSISRQFAMLFNGNYTFFFINFPCYLMGSLHIINFPRYSMGIWGLRSFGGGDGQTYTINGSPLCPTGHWPFGAAAKKGDQLTNQPTAQPTDGLTERGVESHSMQLKIGVLPLDNLFWAIPIKVSSIDIVLSLYLIFRFKLTIKSFKTRPGTRLPQSRAGGQGP